MLCEYERQECRLQPVTCRGGSGRSFIADLYSHKAAVQTGSNDFCTGQLLIVKQCSHSTLAGSHASNKLFWIVLKLPVCQKLPYVMDF